MSLSSADTSLRLTALLVGLHSTFGQLTLLQLICSTLCIPVVRKDFAEGDESVLIFSFLVHSLVPDCKHSISVGVSKH